MKVGDCVASNITNMIGKIKQLCDNGCAIVVCDNKEIYVDLNFWHIVI